MSSINILGSVNGTRLRCVCWFSLYYKQPSMLLWFWVACLPAMTKDSLFLPHIYTIHAPHTHTHPLISHTFTSPAAHFLFLLLLLLPPMPGHAVSNLLSLHAVRLHKRSKTTHVFLCVHVCNIGLRAANVWCDRWHTCNTTIFFIVCWRLTLSSHTASCLWFFSCQAGVILHLPSQHCDSAGRKEGRKEEGRVPACTLFPGWTWYIHSGVHVYVHFSCPSLGIA